MTSEFIFKVSSIDDGWQYKDYLRRTIHLIPLNSVDNNIQVSSTEIQIIIKPDQYDNFMFGKVIKVNIEY